MRNDAVLPSPMPLPAGGRVSDGPLRPHYPNCFGCAPGNPAGLQMQLVRDGDRVRASVCLDRRHEGAPGYAHGGAVAGLLDDAMGGMLIVLWRAAVTARLEVDYAAPVVIGRDLEVEAWVTSIAGRKIDMVARITEVETGTPVARARGLFLAVGPEHFVEGQQADGVPQTAT